MFYFWFLNLKILCNYQILLQQADNEVGAMGKRERGKEGNFTSHILFMPLWQSPAARLLVNLLWVAMLQCCHVAEIKWQLQLPHACVPPSRSALQLQSIVIFHIWHKAAQCWQKISPLNEYKGRRRRAAEIGRNFIKCSRITNPLHKTENSCSWQRAERADRGRCSTAQRGR